MTYGQCRTDRVRVHAARDVEPDRQLLVTTGELIAPTIGPTRTEADFASHIEQTVATDPEAVVDLRGG